MVSGTKCSSNGVTACLTTKAVRGDLGILFHLASGSRPRQCLRAFRERTDLDFRKVGLAVCGKSRFYSHIEQIAPGNEIIGRAESTTYTSHLEQPTPTFSKDRLFPALRRLLELRSGVEGKP